MKTKIALLILIISGILFVVSCKEEDPIDTNEKPENINYDHLPIIFGEESPRIDVTEVGYTVKYEIQGTYYEESGRDSLALDLDNDGLEDFKFHHVFWTNKWGHKDLSKLEIINPDFSLSYTTHSDTLFSCGRVAYYETDIDSTYPLYDTTFYNHESLFDCNHTIGIDEITLTLYPQKNEAGDSLYTINQNTNWISFDNEILLLYEYNYTWGSSLTEYEYFKHIKLKRFFHKTSEPIYLAVKRRKNDTTHYGWISLQKTNDNRIHIISYAFENE